MESKRGFQHDGLLKDYLTWARYNRIMQGHIAIAGGGVIGLACSLALRRRGLQVTVLEAGTAMKEASWAAGGMLAVEDPENPPALLPLSRYSRSLYEEFLEEIRALSGEPVPFRTRETVQLLESAHAGTAGTFLSHDEAQRLVPGLASTAPACLFDEASLDPRDLCAALPLAVRAAGVVLREYERVLSVEAESGGVLLTTERGTVRADAFINCCGAWAGALEPSSGVAPSKGQMLVIAQPEGPRLTRVLRSPEVYLIPRNDHRIVIGATVEDAGYSKQVEPDALAILRKRAAAVWSPAMDAPYVESWAGLRPGSPDGLPLIGRHPEHGAVQFLATGHFRNGILLAPGTARVIADLICGSAPEIDLAPFSPHRASISASCDKHFAAAL
ncbi:MAG: NAD(P)/FAD-dependent oxidoreductase [Acidobacteriaceae bacterium]